MKVRLKKIEERKDALYPNNVAVGYEIITPVSDEFFTPPTVGEIFNLGYWHTSIVVEILTDKTFKTWNSIYEWEVLNEVR